MNSHQQKIKNVNNALEKIRKGETDGVTELYHEMSHTLRYIALKYLKNDAEADDLVQDFWADIDYIADKFIYIRNGFAYLCKVMNRRATNRYKLITGRKEVNIGYVDYAMFDADHTNSLETRDLQISIESAMQELDVHEKIIIQETYFEDKNIRQIARDIGLSKSKVGRLKQRALKKMKDFFEESGTKSSVDC